MSKYERQGFKIIKNNKLILGKINQDYQIKQSIKLSFQIMTRAEPIAVVVATIKSLLAIKSSDDEILIIDNNHTDKALYEPLARYCASIEHDNVRFYHVDKVANFKSGALNLALEIMESSCSHIVVVDSDYQALPHARAAISNAIGRFPTHALLQFPQFYRDHARLDIHSELNHYFNYHIYRTFNQKRALSTGTFAVIQRQALVALGGWSGASITEDAQMGVLMHSQGYLSQFIPEVIATGLLPMTLADLLNQRQRWVYGNMQVLCRYFSKSHQQSMIGAQKPSLSERLSYVRAHLSQLSAWVNFTGLFIFLQLATLLVIVTVLLLSLQADVTVLLTPLYAVYASYLWFLGRRLWAYSHDNFPLNKQVHNTNNHLQLVKSSNDVLLNNHSWLIRARLKMRAWLLHLNFWELGALSWLPVLWGRDKPFVGTPKQAQISTQRSNFIANITALPKLLLGLNLVTALVVAPFSPLYSPLLFACAVLVCLLKLAAATVVFQNYNYVPQDTQIIKFKPVTSSKPRNNALLTPHKVVLSKRTPQTSALVDNHIIANDTLTKDTMANEAVNS